MITKLRRTFLRHPDRQSGTTMAEMIIVVMMLGVILAIVQGTLILAQKTTRSTTWRLNSTGTAKNAIDTVTRNLRTAVLPQLLANGSECTTCASTAFISATPTSVQFFANTNTDQTRLGPVKMTYSVTNGILTETQQKPDAHDPSVYSFVYCTNPAVNSTSCPMKSREVARGIPAGSNLFIYYTDDGVALTGSSLSTAQLGQVDNIDVTIPIQFGDEKSTLTQRVTLPNADSIALASPTAAP